MVPFPGWIGVDLDSTLAEYRWPEVGPPIPLMLARVKALMEAGFEVRIFTARVGPTADEQFVAVQRAQIEAWCEVHLGCKLQVTASKDFGMICLFDDRAIQVEADTGRLLTPTPSIHGIALI